MAGAADGQVAASGRWLGDSIADPGLLGLLRRGLMGNAQRVCPTS